MTSVDKLECEERAPEETNQISGAEHLFPLLKNLKLMKLTLASYQKLICVG
jgi:hypothetical protein